MDGAKPAHSIFSSPWAGWTASFIGLRIARIYAEELMYKNTGGEVGTVRVLNYAIKLHNQLSSKYPYYSSFIPCTHVPNAYIAGEVHLMYRG